MKITKSRIRQLIKEELAEAFRLEKDFKEGTTVYWDTLVNSKRTLPSGKVKVDTERVTVTGVVEELLTSAHGAMGLAIVRDPSGASHEIEVSELRATPQHAEL
jgi:hypothetical protein